MPTFCFNPPLAGKGLERIDDETEHDEKGCFNPPLAGKGLERKLFQMALEAVLTFQSAFGWKGA